VTKDKVLGVVAELIKEQGRPLNVGEIIKLADTRLPTNSRTPQNILHKHLSLEVKNNAASKFMRVSPGTYGLRED